MVYGGRVQQITVCPPLNATPSATTPVPDTPVASQKRTSLNVLAIDDVHSLHRFICKVITLRPNKSGSKPKDSAYPAKPLDNSHNNASSHSCGVFKSLTACRITAHTTLRYPV